MHIINRNGDLEFIDVKKIQDRIEKISKDPYPLSIDPAELSIMVISRIKDSMTTTEIDLFTSKMAYDLSPKNIDYMILAGRIEINNHHKNTLNTFSDKIKVLYDHVNPYGKHTPLIKKSMYDFVMKNKDAIDSKIDYSRDYMIDVFGFKTLENTYLFKLSNGKVIERPQDMYMRVAIQMYYSEIDPETMNTHSLNLVDGNKNLPAIKDDSAHPSFLWGIPIVIKNLLEKIFRVYDNMSNMLYTHATPTLFNAGSYANSCSSCYLTGIEDSVGGINKSYSNISQISKNGGGVGLPVTNIRSKGSYINGTNGRSNGIVPFLRIFNEIGKAFNQGGKRNGSFAIYLEPHHGDLMEFLNLKKTQGDENLKCKDLFTALWISDLFMERLQTLEDWSVFDPYECPGLDEVYGQEYRDLYLKYESAGLAKAKYPMSEIIHSIYESQIERGVPYILFKDTSNIYSMQKNIGIIKSSNLCTEIMLVSDSENYSVCNLASISLSKFVVDTYTNPPNCDIADRLTPNNEFPIVPKFDFQRLREIVHEIVENLNHVIDKTLNPTVECYRSNFSNRPIGIGIQGLNDVFMKFKYPFASPEARALNRKIAETIYFAALERSCELAKELDEDLRNFYKYCSGLTPKVLELNGNTHEKVCWIKRYPLTKIEYEDLPDFHENNKLNGVLPLWGSLVYTASNFVSRIANLDEDTNCIRPFLYHYCPGHKYGSYPSFYPRRNNFESEFAYRCICTYGFLKPLEKGNDSEDNKDKSKIIIKDEPPILEQFHWEMYGLKKEDLCGDYDWETLRENIKKHGIRNSTLIAYMPTASTSQIMGNTPCFEPYMSNIYKRKTLAGVFTVINKYLINDLKKANLWNKNVKNFLLENEGSVQNIKGFPPHLKELYKTIWEIKQKDLIQLAADRQPFVDQSQSLNIYLEKYSPSICASIMLMTWKLKLKTGMYYTKIKPNVEAQKFTVNYGDGKELEVDPTAFDDTAFSQTAQNSKKKSDAEMKYDCDDSEACVLCSS